MGKINSGLMAFNRGEVSRLALGRIDLDRMRLSAEEQENFLPLVLGPMTLRPGLQYLGSTRSNLKPRFLEFVFGNSDTAALELTSANMRVWIDDEVVTRAAVNTTVTNGDFASAGGWNLSPDVNILNTASISGGVLNLNARAKGETGYCWRSVFVPQSSRNIEHAFRIVVSRGPVTFKCGTANPLGTSSTTDDLIETTVLGEGTHSLAFTPTTSAVYVYFETNDMANRIVTEITVEAAGALTLPTPWAAADLDYIRPAQSGDIIFVACEGVHPYKIERRSTTSWSVVKFLTKNGPMKAAASVENCRVTPGATFGNTTLISNKALFTNDHVGVLFRLFQTGQLHRTVLAAADEYTDPIRITGVTGSDRKFGFVVTGLTGTGSKLVLERSTEEGDLGQGFKTVFGGIDNNGTYFYKDLEAQGANADNDPNAGNFTNVICFYRVGISNYQGGAITVDFREGSGNAGLKSGGGTGYCRVTGYTNAKLVNIEILKPFSSLNHTEDWQEGEWSESNGYPSSVAFHDGRLWWAGGDKIWGSVSDDYSNFDIEKEGDAGPIQRSVGFGPVDTINWMLPLTRLILGRSASESSVRSSSLDEPITPTSFTLKDCSTKGSARIGAIKCDTRGVFVGKSGRKLYELLFEAQSNDYQAHDLTRLHPDVSGSEGFTRICIQHNPDTTVHCVRDDGQVAVLLYDKEDEVEAWWRVETDGVVEDAFVLPGTHEDNVYYVVRRTINSSTVRYLEKFALRSQCSGLPEARLSDSHIVDTGGDRTITGLSHLEGETVVAWGWNNAGATGFDLGTYTVTSGRIVVSTAYNNVCVGLPYNASFTSAKLAYAADQGTALNQRKRLIKLGLLLYDTHYQGLRYGQRVLGEATVTMTVAGPAVVTDTGHGFGQNQQVIFTSTGSLPSGLISGRIYYVAGSVLANSYNLAATPGGALITTSGSQSGVHTRTATALDALPLVSEGATTAADTVYSEFDETMIEVPGEWDTDARLILKAASPRPCTVAAAVVNIQTNG